METKSSYIDSHKNPSKSKVKIKPLHVFIIFFLLSTLIAFLLGGFYIAQDKENKEQLESTEITEHVKLSASSIPDNPDTWTEFTLENIGISLQLPKNLVEKGEWNEIELENEYGNYVCFTYNKLEASDDCDTDDLIITSASSDYSQDQISFFASKGIISNNGTYSLINSNNSNVGLQNEKTKPLENVNGFEILKILGNDTNTSPDIEYLGAIIDTNNETYPALIIQMEIDGVVSEYEFDQILESVNNIN